MKEGEVAFLIPHEQRPRSHLESGHLGIEGGRPYRLDHSRRLLAQIREVYESVGLLPEPHRQQGHGFPAFFD